MKSTLVSAIFAASHIAYGAQTIGTQVSPDGLWRVEIADYMSPSRFELWSTPTVGGVRRKIGHTVPHDHDVFEFVIARDSSRVAYRQGRTATGESKLYSTRIDAPTGAQISQPIPPSSRVEPGISLASGGTRVRYRWSELAGGVGDWYAVPFGGGTPLPEIFADGFESGNQGAWK